MPSYLPAYTKYRPLPLGTMLEPNYKQYADYFLMGLESGLINQSEIITWVDKLISTSPHPQDWMIELATCGQKKSSDIFNLLSIIPGEEDINISLGLFLAKLTDKYPLVTMEVIQVCRYLYKYTDDKNVLADLQACLYLIDDYLDYVGENCCESPDMDEYYQKLISFGLNFHQYIQNI